MIKMDNEDYPLFIQNKDKAHIIRGYLFLGDKGFHRFIIPMPKDGLRRNVKFKNGNTLDLQKENLIVGNRNEIKQAEWKQKVIDTVSNLKHGNTETS